MALPLFFTKCILVSFLSLTLCVVTSTEASQSAVNASENQSRHGKGLESKYSQYIEIGLKDQLFFFHVLVLSLFQIVQFKVTIPQQKIMEPSLLVKGKNG